MTLYRDTTTGEVWTEEELKTALRKEIEGLDDEDSLKQDMMERGDGAIRDYIIECCLVGIYSQVDQGPIAYRRTLDGRVFRADEMEDVFFDDTLNLESDAREEITFTGCSPT